MDLNPSIMESLISGQYSKVTRTEMSSGIFGCPILQYESDGEADDDNAQEGNRQHEVQGPGLVEPIFQSLEQLNPQHDHQSDDKLRRIMALSNIGNRLMKDEIVDLPETLSTTEWVEFLVKMGPVIVEGDSKNPVLTSRILRKLSKEIQVLAPGNDADEGLGDWRDRSQWRRQLGALAAELMTVDDMCSCEVRDAGVFVLTRFDYPALLETLAKEITDQTGGVA